MIHYIQHDHEGRVVASGMAGSGPELGMISRAAAPLRLLRVPTPIIDLADWRIVNKELVRLPVKPAGHARFDYTAGAWVLDNAAALAALRARRDQLLASSDWVALRAAEQGQPVPEAWRTYRQALRDMPLQDVTQPQWPECPA